MNLKANARDLGLQLSQTIGFAFRRRYNLPPTDPRWLNATLEDVYLDVWAHAHIDDPNLKNEVVADGYDEDLAEMEAAALELEKKHAANPPLPPKVPAEDDWEEMANDRWEVPVLPVQKAQKR